METPESGNKGRPVRKHTPRLSERKKSLFASNNNVNANNEDIMEGIVPLTNTANDEENNVYLTPLIKKRVLSVYLESATNSPQTEDSTKENNNKKKQKLQPARRSLRLYSKSSPTSKAVSPANSEKENAPIQTKNIDCAASTEDHLEELFLTSMCLENQRSPKTPQNQIDANRSNNNSNITDLVMDSDDSLSEHSNHKMSEKRRACKSNSASPQKKILRMEEDASQIKINSISTKSFYSGKIQNPRCTSNNNKVFPKLMHRYSLPATLSESKKSKSPTSASRNSERRNIRLNVHKGVKHNIRRPRQLMTHSTNIDYIISNMSNDKLRKLITAERKEKQQIKEIHNIFRKAKNPIEMAKPLSALSKDDNINNNNEKDNNNSVEHDKLETTLQKIHQEVDFSDLETESETDEDDESVVNENAENANDLNQPEQTEPQTPQKKRKFFKSGATKKNVKEVTITDHIKASVSNGKISLIKKKKRRRVKLRPVSTHEFSAEQATVDEILQQLDDNAFNDIEPKSPADDKPADTSFTSSSVPDSHISFDETLNDIEFSKQEPNDYIEFRQRLPYNTNDRETIARQKLLLDFLIKNNICNENTFNIFIADPENHKEEASEIVDQVVMVVNKKSKFFDRLPYNTEDPDIIAQQHSFLYFLNEHNLCTEENFDIFIANYETRTEEAEAIVEVVQRQFRYTSSEVETTEDANDMPIPNVNTFNQKFLSSNNSAPVIDESNELSNTITNETPQKQFLDSNQTNITSAQQSPVSPIIPQSSVITTPVKTTSATLNNSNTEIGNQKSEKLFPIFDVKQWRPLIQEAQTRKMPRNWNAGYGSNQYQIDAGQKNFGAQQCKVCGLVYTVHEPEEEKLHREFHSSVFVLSFKGWIDEDIVTKVPEWGNDGRILRITEVSSVKRRERLMEVLTVVDKELGFSSYIIPNTFVAFLAVRKNQFIGLCLVQPLKTANRYLCINGVDCCTNEEFEAKCGISRIWVSPLNRRRKVASKLLNAVQNFTTLGVEIPLDKIAFSAPTEAGKIFAKKITKTENFLVYQ